MPDTVFEFFLQRDDAAWATEIFLYTFSWLLIRFGTGKKKGGVRIVLEFLLFLIMAVVIDHICVIIVYPRYTFALLRAFGFGLLSYGYLLKLSEYRRGSRILLWLAMYLSSICVMGIAGQSSILAGQFISPGPFEGVTRILIYALMPVVACYLRRYNFDEFKVFPQNGYVPLIYGIVCVMIIYLVEGLIMVDDYRLPVVFVTSYICMFAMTLTVIHTIYTVCHEQNELLDLQAQKQRLLAEREMTQMTERKLEDLRCIRHDLKNQYSYMQILLTEERYDELKEYFSKLSENLPEQLNVIDCGNRTMNTVLNMEMAKLRSDKINVEHQLVVPPVLPFPDEDVCSIVTNMLDNAGEECRKLLKRGWESADMRFEIYPHSSYLYLKCINSTDRNKISHNKGGIITTKKEDKEMHGYGTRIISKLAEKYNGCADFTLEDGKFITQVMLDMGI